MNDRAKSNREKAKRLNVLMVEDVEDDAILLVRHLGGNGFDVKHRRVSTAEELRAVLAESQDWDVVLCDHGLTGFNSIAALEIVRDQGLDLPFIVVSGTIGEERAADVMRAGAHDLIVKDNLSRLIPAIERELKDAEGRRAKARADKQLDMERRLLANLMTNTPDAVYFRDLDHRYLRLNAAEAQVIDAASAEAALGKRVDEVLPPDRAALRLQEEKKIFATGEPLIDRIERVPQADGSVRWFSATKAPIRDRQGKIIGLVGITRDVTKRMAAEEALSESEQRFRTVVNSSPAAVVLKDRQGRYLLVNETFARWMNQSVERIVGKTAFDLYSRKEAEETAETDRRVFDTGETLIAEKVRSFGDGSARNVIVHNCPILSAAGKVNAISVTVTDITNFKKAEKARRQSEKRLRGAIESLQEGFALFDKDDRIVALNEKYRKMHPDAQRIMENGGTFEDLIRSIVARGLIVDAKGREEEFIRERLERHRRPKGPIILQFADGSWRMIQESHTPEGGRALSFVDITGLKRAEDEIRKLSSAVEQAPLGLIITDTEGTIEYVNAALTEITGYDANEAIGRNPRMLQSGRTPLETYREMWSTITAGKVWRGTLTNKRKDGTFYPAAAIVSPITAADGSITHYVGAQEDITRQLERENILKQVEKVESLGSLAGGIAHDFNNMLLPIIALTKMTLKKLPETSEHRERLEKVVQAATRARDLVAQILRFSRREELKQEIVDVGGIMDEALGLLRTTLPSTIKTKDSRSLTHGKVFADAAEIGTVLLNLASNAADAMEGKPGEIAFSLSRHVIGDEYLMGFESAKAGPYAKIAVSDTGQGMDEATMKRIFEPFFTTKGVGKGTGLGLATAYGIITKHGGMIYVASEIGKGTTFDIYLPLIEDAKAGRPPAGDARDTRVRGSENAAALKR